MTRSVLVATLIAFAIADIATAQSPAGPRLVDVRVGFDQRYKLGCWTAVELTLDGGNEAITGTVELTTADGDDVPVRYRSKPVGFGLGFWKQQVVVLAKFGRRDVTATVAFVVNGKKRFEQQLALGGDDEHLGLPAPLASNDRLVVCVGRMPSLDATAAALDLGGANVIVANVADPARLPLDSLAYEGVDAVVLAPDRPGFFGLSRFALNDWLKFGGDGWIVLSDVTAPLFAEDIALSGLVDLAAGDAVALPRTSALEKFAGDERQQPISSTDFRRKPLLVPRVTTPDVVVDAAEGDLPLVLRRAYGLGDLVVTTFDPEHPLLASWPGRQAVVRKVLNRLGVLSDREWAAAEGQSGPPSAPKNVGNYGYDDLAGQLRSALDNYEGVQTVSFFSLAVMLIGFIALVGPLDYWFVRRVLKRPEMTWITFPTIVVATSVGAYFLAVHFKGTELRVSRACVVDCDAATGAIRTTSWAGVFSPVGQTYDVRFDGPSKLVTTSNVQRVTGWFGLPGGGLGGMHSGGGGSWLAQSYLEQPNDRGLVGVPIPIWSSKMFRGSLTDVSANKLHEPLSVAGDNRLRGAIRNPFAADVREAFLCYGPRAYEIGSLNVGESRDVAAVTVRDLQMVLQDWRVVLSANKNPLHVGLPHDPGSRDVETILRKMMFYTAAGGEDHANLANRFHSPIDLSALLSLRRAVLVGKIDPAAVGGLSLSKSDGSEKELAKETRTAFVRLVIPVTNE